MSYWFLCYEIFNPSGIYLRNPDYGCDRGIRSPLDRMAAQWLSLCNVDTLRFACTCRFLSGRKPWYEYRESRTQHLCHNMRHRDHTPARHFTGDEHGNRTEPLRTSHGWSIYTMAVRAQISDNYHIKLIINRSGSNIWPRSILNN